MHTITSILQITRRFFEEKAIDTARLDAEVLLAHTLGVSRVYLYTHGDRPLTSEECDVYREKVRRRGRCEPVAYIVGEREFYGRAFVVDRRVLIPRPETEHMVETALGWLEKTGCRHPSVWEIGVGSGALAVTLALECEGARVLASDVSSDAMDVARLNAQKWSVWDKIEWREGASLDVWGGETFDMVLSNPPYVESDAVLDKDVREYEPHQALFAGLDGLDVLRVLCGGVKKVLKTPGVFICEIGQSQNDTVKRLLREAGFEHVYAVKDLAGIERVIVGEQ